MYIPKYTPSPTISHDRSSHLTATPKNVRILQVAHDNVPVTTNFLTLNHSTFPWDGVPREDEYKDPPGHRNLYSHFLCDTHSCLSFRSVIVLPVLFPHLPDFSTLVQRTGTASSFLTFIHDAL